MEEEGFDRNGRLQQGRSPLCMYIDSCQLCSRTAGRTAAAHCTHPHLFGTGVPSSLTDKHTGWVLNRYRHSNRVVRTQLGCSCESKISSSLGSNLGRNAKEKLLCSPVGMPPST